jgi:hypothetical protein
MERRRDERLPVRSKEGVPETDRFPYRIVNVSKSGCSVASRHELWPAEAATVLDLPLPGRADRLRVSARVVWKGSEHETAEAEPFLYGLEFEKLDKGSQLILDLYLDYLRRELHLARLDEAWRKLKLAHEKINLLLAWEERKASPYLH